MEKFFYEVAEMDGGQHLIFYDRKGGPLRIIGTSRYDGDPCDLEAIRRRIDEHFNEDSGVAVELPSDYVVHRIVIGDELTVKSGE